MKDRFKYPLVVTVVWHPDYGQGKSVANELYSLFTRDTERPLSRGLGIPVYFRSTVLAPIELNLASRNAIILLVDENFMTDGAFRTYTEDLTKKVDDNNRIFPIALCSQAHTMGCGISEVQFLRDPKGHIDVTTDFDSGMKRIRTELLHDSARLLMNLQPTWLDKAKQKIPMPVKLFLSHAKNDGEETTKKFKVYVESETKLDVFFDTVDIADSYEFEQQIEANIKNAALVVFHTDDYSTREWCRIEVLVAKRNKCSIVVVHDIKHGEKRAFPYMGNTPTITLKNNEVDSFYEIVSLTLYQVVNNLFQLELLSSFEKLFESKGTEFISITSPPELFNYIDIYKKMQEEHNQIIVLYPEPPLGAEELKILSEINKDIKFTTPVNLPTLI